MGIRTINPNFLPHGADGLTYRPDLRVRVERVERLETEPLWQAAPLTAYARSAIPLHVRHALTVTPVGQSIPVGLLIVLAHPPRHWWRAPLGLSERHDVGLAGGRERQVVVTAGRVEGEVGVEEWRGLARIADVLVGTAAELPPPLPPTPARIPRRDAAAIAALGW